MTACPICDSELNNDERNSKSVGNSFLFFSCPRCGEYKVYNTLYEDRESKIDPLSNDEKSVLVSHLRQKSENRNPCELTSNRLKEIINSKILDRKSKIKLLMRKIDKETSIGQNFVVNENIKNQDPLALQGYAGILNDQEYEFYINYLKEIKLIERPGSNKLKITFKGYDYLDNVGKDDSNNIFCAMWFDDSMNNAWTNAIRPAIAEAGYNPVRIDEVEHSEDINDKVLNEIKDSKLVIADFTGHRGGVYFESGYARALGKVVIHCCNNNCKKDLHFDIRNINTIFWEEEKLAEFKNRLLEAIKYLD